MTEEQKQIVEKKIFGHAYRCNVCYNTGFTFKTDIYNINPSQKSPNLLMCSCKNCGHVMFWDLEFILKDEQQGNDAKHS